jgi:hypothetical protein
MTATDMGADNATGILQPSAKAQGREREALRQLINPQQCYTHLPELIERLNRHLRGWANYFGLGYPRKTFCDLNQSFRAVPPGQAPAPSQSAGLARPTGH